MWGELAGKKHERQVIRGIAVTVCLALCFLTAGPTASFAGGDPYAAFNPETAYRIPEKPALESEAAIPENPANEGAAFPRGSLDVSSSPLSQAETQDPAGITKVKLTDQEQENIRLLLAELCATVQCSDTTGMPDEATLAGGVLPVQTNKVDDYEKMLRELLSNLKKTDISQGQVAPGQFVSDTSSQKNPEGQGVPQQTGDVSQPKSLEGQAVLDQLKEFVSRWLSLPTMSNGLSAYTSYQPGASKEIAQGMISGLQTTEAYVRDKVDNVRENFQGEGFRAEIERSMAMDQMLAAAVNKDPVGETGQRYRVLQSVTLDPQLAAMHLLMNPPPRLHPFTRWYLYKKYMTRERLQQYEEAREKVLAIYQLAKEGKGLIRYKGRIGFAYLPFMNEKGGSYELVQRS